MKGPMERALEKDLGAPQADGLSSQATEPKVSALRASIPSAALLTLAERCERAAGPDTALDLAIRDALGLSWKAAHDRYTASLDAAMTLVPEGWEFTIRRKFAELRHPTRRRCDGTSFSATPALALCAAALRARAAQ